jgi:hypothetical protein
MLDRVDAAKLHETSTGDGVDRLTGRIRYEVQMGVAHAKSPHAKSPLDRFGLWIVTLNSTQAGDKSGFIPMGSKSIQA